jgi:hypothetical protein
MPNGIRIHFAYRGPSVDDGTMPLSDVGEAILGFTDAYAKIAHKTHPGVSTQLRLSDVNPGSFELLILSWISAAQVAGGDFLVETAKAAAHAIIAKLVELIALKRHTKGEKFSTEIHGDRNNVVVINAEKLQLVVPRDAAELLQSRMVDRALSQITAPLDPGRIESAEVSTEDGGEPIKAVIRSEERQYFQLKPVPLTTERAEIDGYLTSLNKNTGKGRFKPTEGKSMIFRYVGTDLWRFYADFAYRGPVRVSGATEFDEDGKPVSIDIESVERLD